MTFYECKNCGWSDFGIEKSEFQCPSCGSWIKYANKKELAARTNHTQTNQILFTPKDLENLQKSLELIRQYEPLRSFRENLTGLLSKIKDLVQAYPEGFTMDLPIIRNPDNQERYLLNIENRRKKNGI